MMQRKFSGQEAVEFILITALVGISALTVVVIFGGKISAFFTSDSSIHQVAKNKTMIINASSSQKYDTPIEAIPELGSKKMTISGIEFIQKKNGDLIGTLNGEKFIVTQQLQDKYTAAMESVATDGLQEFISTIKQMAETYNVPVDEIEVMVGDANKTTEGKQCKAKFFGGKSCKNVTGDMKGKASTSASLVNNVIILKYKENIVIKQKDQQCSNLCSFQGKFELKGTLDANNKFTSDISGDFTGKYSSNITLTDNQLIFNTGGYTLNSANKKGDQESKTLWWGGKDTDVYPKGNLKMTFPREGFSFAVEEDKPEQVTEQVGESNAPVNAPGKEQEATEKVD